MAVIEGATESVLIFYSFTSLNPLVSVILMCGVYEFSSVRYSFKSCTEKCIKQNRTSRYTIPKNSNGTKTEKSTKERMFSWIKWIASHFIENTLKLVVILVPLQLATTEKNARIQIAIASICLTALSLIWSKKLQKSTFSASKHSKNKAEKKQKAGKVKGRWKASKYKFMAISK